MPTYIYKNTKTNQITSLFMSISEMEEKQQGDVIVLDGEEYTRDYQSEMSGMQGSCASWPMKSDAAGCHPSQAKEFYDNASSRGVPTDFCSETGQAIFTSRQHRAKYLKAMGMHDRNGGYGD